MDLVADCEFSALSAESRNQAVPSSNVELDHRRARLREIDDVPQNGHWVRISPALWTYVENGKSNIHTRRFNGTTTFRPQHPIDKAFASELMWYWLSFVPSGDSNAHKLVRALL